MMSQFESFFVGRADLDDQKVLRGMEGNIPSVHISSTQFKMAEGNVRA